MCGTEQRLLHLVLCLTKTHKAAGGSCFMSFFETVFFLRLNVESEEVWSQPSGVEGSFFFLKVFH